VLAAAAAACLFLLSWTLLHEGFYTRDQVVDTPVYQNYGDAIARGEVPYRDFRPEYPPGALPVFALPSLLREPAGDLEGYRRAFEGLMAALGAATVLLVAATLTAVGASTARLLAALAFVALAPLAVGSVVLSRFDLWPAALTAGALAALVSGRLRLGSVVLGLAIAAKLYPAVLLPLLVVYALRRAGRREAVVCGGVAVAVPVLAYLPFAIVGLDGVLASLGRQLSRPLQIESLGSSFLLAAHQALGLDITMESSHGSQNLDGALPLVLGLLQSVVQIAALVLVWVWFARGRAEPERLLLASAAAVCAFVALGKVLSPQFLIWLVPLVPLVAGRRGLVASGLLAAALVLTQLWFPYRYWELALEFDALSSWLVLVRDLVLVALTAVLTLGVRSTRIGQR
jgi:hypothetical protein